MTRVPGDLIRTKSDEAAIDAGCYFDPGAADRVRRFFAGFLRHSKGGFAGSAFELLDWQWQDIVRPLFGWMRPDGTRRFRRAGIAIAKKNGKSTLLSGIGLYGLIADGEPGAEVYSAGADRDQASIIYNEAANMVEASPSLNARLVIARSKRTLHAPLTKSIYKALSADVPTKEGLNIHYLLFDELHAQKTYNLWNALKYGGAARRQPLLLWISTAGFDKLSLCYEQWQHARAVIESREIDVDALYVLYEARESDDWKDPAVHRAANPSLGSTIPEAGFASDAAEAGTSIASENAFKRYRLNIWTNQETKWIDGKKWDACAESYTWDDFVDFVASLGEKRAYAAFDLSNISDIAALMLGAIGPDGRLNIWARYWLPREVAKQRERDGRARLMPWITRGHITETPGDVIDYGHILTDFQRITDSLGGVRLVGVDPWNATQFTLDLMGEGFKCEYIRQGFRSLSPAAKELEKRVAEKTIVHPGCPVLAWMIGNAAVKTDPAGNIKPHKAKSGDKIDGVSALVSLIAAMHSKPPGKRSKYETTQLDGA